MNDQHKIIALVHLDPEVGSSDLDDIHAYSQQLEHAAHLVNSLIGSVSGRLIGNIGEYICSELPLSEGAILKEIQERVQDEAHVLCHIGVGEDSDSAKKAVEQAKASNLPIKVHCEYEEQPEESSEPMQKAESPSLLDDSAKAKVIQIAQTLQQNEKAIEQLKQESPDTYTAIVSTIQSITSLLQADKQDRQALAVQHREEIDKNIEHDKNQEKIELIRNILDYLDRSDDHESDHPTGASDDSGDEFWDQDYTHPEYDEHLARNADLSDADEPTESLQKADIPEEFKQKVAATFAILEQNDEVLQRLKQSNPQASAAVEALVESLGRIMQQKTGEDPGALMHQYQIESGIEQHSDEDPGQQPEEVVGHPRAGKDEKIHQRKMVYAPGSIREDSPQDARIKTPSGEWKHLSTQEQRPEE